MSNNQEQPDNSPSTYNMATRKLTLEISESLFQQLEQLAELTEESIERTAIWSMLCSLPSLTKRARDLNEMLDQVTPETLHGEIDFGEPVGREIW
jgi:antitoxin MazE